MPESGSAVQTGLLGTKQTIRQQLEATVKLAVSTSQLDKPLSREITQTLCTVIEAIFIHGLRDAFFLKGSRYSKQPMPNFWPFVSKYTHRSIKQQIAALNQIKSEVGKARAWIRIVLSENALEHYITLFSKDGQVNQFYDKQAFIRDQDCIVALNTYLKTMNRVQIVASINSSLLNNWTPSPLVLAGLIKGKSINALLPSKQTTENDGNSASSSNNIEIADELMVESAEEPEVGMNALDLLTPPGSVKGNPADLDQSEKANSSFDQDPFANYNSTFEGTDQNNSLLLEEDTESLLSHPSMLMEEPFVSPRFDAAKLLRLPTIVGVTESGSGNGGILQTNFAGSNNSSSFGARRLSWMDLKPAEEHTSEVIVHRRKTGRRRAVSRSSGGAGGGSDTGGSNAGGSRSRTQSVSNLEPPNEGQIQENQVSTELEQKQVDESGSVELAQQTDEKAKMEEEEEEKQRLLHEANEQALLAMAGDDEDKKEETTVETDGIGIDSSEQKADEQREKKKSNVEPMDTADEPGTAAVPPAMMMIHGQRLVDEMELPLGTSLQEELLMTNNQRFGTVEKAAEVIRPNNRHYQQMGRPRKSSEPQIHSSNSAAAIISAAAAPPIVGSPQTQADFFSFGQRRAATFTAVYSTDSSSNDLPATFDEALREFLNQEAGAGGQKLQDNKKQQQRLEHSESNKRLFSECSSSSNGAETPALFAAQSQQKLLLNESAQSSTTNILPDIYASGTAADETVLRPSRELPAVPLESEVGRFVEQTEDGDQLVEIAPFESGDGIDLAASQTSFVGQQQEPYRIQKRLLHLIRLPIEQGLDKQNFRCKTCRRNIGAGFGPFRTCALTGFYFCENCSRGGEDLIPARAILNGDFRPRTVSKDSRTLLRSIADRPLFRLDVLNPHIYEQSRQLRKCRDLRRRLGLLVMYLLSCKNNIADDIKRRLWPHNHLHSDLHLYSIMDLECVANGTMERRLNALISFALAHVQSCPLCMQKGFFCELCSSSRPIYPFQTDITYQCPRCSSCYHRECARKAGLLPAAASDSKKTSIASSNNSSDNKSISASTQELQQQQLHQNCPKCLRRVKYSSAALNTLGSPLSSSPAISSSRFGSSSNNIGGQQQRESLSPSVAASPSSSTMLPPYSSKNNGGIAQQTTPLAIINADDDPPAVEPPLV